MARRDGKVRVERAEGEDPDIAGIRPGPQPLPEEFADLGEIPVEVEEGEEVEKG